MHCGRKSQQPVVCIDDIMSSCLCCSHPLCIILCLYGSLAATVVTAYAADAAVAYLLLQKNLMLV